MTFLPRQEASKNNLGFRSSDRQFPFDSPLPKATWNRERLRGMRYFFPPINPSPSQKISIFSKALKSAWSLSTQLPRESSRPLHKNAIKKDSLYCLIVDHFKEVNITFISISRTEKGSGVRSRSRPRLEGWAGCPHLHDPRGTKRGQEQLIPLLRPATWAGGRLQPHLGRVYPSHEAR